MIAVIAATFRFLLRRAALLLAALAALLAAPALAQQLETYDPDQAYQAGEAAGGIDADLATPPSTSAVGPDMSRSQ